MPDPITDEFNATVRDALRIGREAKIKKLESLRATVLPLSPAWIKYTEEILKLKSKATP